jgi:fido (protein-threonine AMPylation protein)
MPDDLPIYSESTLRTSLQFADLERLRKAGLSEVWKKADGYIEMMEGASGVQPARAGFSGVSKQALARLHDLLFAQRPGAGHFRGTELRPLYRGQDCAPPEFIERSLENMADWLGAESFSQIHPIEQCALAIARVIDIWPFEFGNLTVALVLGNSFLGKAGLAPFFILPEHRAEFDKAIAQSMTIDMQPLINAIYRTVKREMESLAG